MHVSTSQLAVDGADCQKQGFRQQSEFQVDFGQPVYEDAAHLFIHIRLAFHLLRVCSQVALGLQAVGVHVLGLQCAIERIGAVLLVAFILSGLEVDAVDD